MINNQRVKVEKRLEKS